MHKYTKTIIVITSLSMSFIKTPLAFATTNIAENIGNGSGSLNSATATSFKSSVIALRNISNTENDVTTSASSGNNSTNGNIGGGEIETGDSTSKTVIENASSSNNVILPCDCDSQENFASNKNNGADSVNIAAADSVKLTAILLDNINRGKNNTTTLALSGDNKANENVGGGSISTGDAKAETKIVNPSSENNVVAAGTENSRNSNNAQNSGNGAASLNSATATSFESLDLALRNRNNSINNTSTIADSGKNLTNKNIGGGSIETGNADSKTNIIGSSIKNLVDLSCNCNAQENKAKSAGNGTESVNIVSASSTLLRSALLDNLNRSRNNALTLAQSGANKSNKNIGGGSIKTGNNNALTNIGSSSIFNRLSM